MMTFAEQLVYATAFVATLQGPSHAKKEIATIAARDAAVHNLRMASTYLDPQNNDDRFAHMMLDTFRTTNR